MSKRTHLVQQKLPFAYADLEPVLNAQILETHYSKHHAGYVRKYNALMDKVLPHIISNNTREVQKHLVKLHFLLGGHNCHALYWENLLPTKLGGGVVPSKNSPLVKAIILEWGSVQKFQAAFNKKTGGIMGSGWGWLAVDEETKSLSIEATYA